MKNLKEFKKEFGTYDYLNFSIEYTVKDVKDIASWLSPLLSDPDKEEMRKEMKNVVKELQDLVRIKKEISIWRNIVKSLPLVG